MTLSAEVTYKKGDLPFYHESDQVFKVEILENKSDERVLQYTFRILQTIKGPLIEDIEPSSLERTCIKGQGANGATWYLTDNPFKPLH